MKANRLIVNVSFAWEGAVAITKPEDEGTYVSRRFPQFRFTDDQIPSYHKYAFSTPQFEQQLSLCSYGSGGRNKLLNLKEFINIEVSCPSLEEQKKIVELFSQVDQTIHATQQELDGYKDLKSYLLQKIFE